MESTNPIENIWANPKNRPWLIGGAILAVVIVIFIICKSCTTTVAEYRESTERKLNYELSSSRHELRKFVESAHVSVTVYSAYVSDIQIITKDGSDNAGYNGSNIRQMHLEITTRWNGIFHKGGETIIGVDFENINGELKATHADFIRSDAIVNIASAQFWLELCGILILLL